MDVLDIQNTHEVVTSGSKDKRGLKWTYRGYSLTNDGKICDEVAGVLYGDTLAEVLVKLAAVDSDGPTQSSECVEHFGDRYTWLRYQPVSPHIVMGAPQSGV